MATKTFKIGLSNTDKQNMAQDVYERLLALTFPEYETTESYEVGDFVVYNDQLYKCIGATSGAWDSSKWQLATLNDLVTDIENAVAFVNDKANVNGNYPTMTVGFADNLTPYDESAGDDQDEPFILQATGTGNGSQPDFATGSGALMKEKQGNTVVVNQSFHVRSTAVTESGITITPNQSDNSFTVNGTSTQTDSNVYITLTNIDLPIGYFKTGHKYLVLGISDLLAKATTKSADTALHIPLAGASSSPYTGALKEDGIVTISAPNTSATRFYLLVKNGNSWDNVKAKINFIDLTQWFNGDIPQDILDNPSNFFRYYQGSLAYNNGELVNADGRYIKCIGMNQWDEEWELGSILSSDGSNIANNLAYRSKNYIRVNPNTEYYVKSPTNVFTRFYDKDKNYISNADANGNIARKDSVMKIPSNCCYFRFVLDGTTYNNDISINLYYEDEPRCLTYEPYQVLTNNDTGSEQLLAFDYKTPDGVWHKNTKKVLDLSSLSWTYSATYNAWYSDSVSDIKEDAKYIANNYVKVDYTDMIGSGASAIGIWVNTDIIRIWIRNGSSTTQPSGELQYETNAPTTEQGTPYSENLVIDDFGSMDFGGTNGVPQGALIFYPVDYKAFVDTLYKYTDGTPSNIALKSDLSGFLTQQDLSSEITDKAGLTYSKKKAIKTGNLVTLTIVATNNTASAIPSNTTLFQLSNSLTPSVALYPIVLVHSTIAYSTINNANGNVSVNAELGTGKAVYINICYCL